MPQNPDIPGKRAWWGTMCSPPVWEVQPLLSTPTGARTLPAPYFRREAKRFSGQNFTPELTMLPGKLVASSKPDWASLGAEASLHTRTHAGDDLITDGSRPPSPVFSAGARLIPPQRDDVSECDAGFVGYSDHEVIHLH
jgi:hypothetical protein